MRRLVGLYRSSNSSSSSSSSGKDSSSGDSGSLRKKKQYPTAKDREAIWRTINEDRDQREGTPEPTTAPSRRRPVSGVSEQRHQPVGSEEQVSTVEWQDGRDDEAAESKPTPWQAAVEDSRGTTQVAQQPFNTPKQALGQSDSPLDGRGDDDVDVVETGPLDAEIGPPIDNAPFQRIMGRGNSSTSSTSVKIHVSSSVLKLITLKHCSATDSWMDFLEGIKCLSETDHTIYLSGPIDADDAEKIRQKADSIENISIEKDPFRSNQIYRSDKERRREDTKPSKITLTNNVPRSPSQDGKGDEEFRTISFSAIAQLSTARPEGGPFFPNLKRIRFHDPVDLAVYPLLLSPKLKSLELSFFRDSEDLLTECASFLQALSTVALDLRILNVWWSPASRLLSSLPLFKNSVTTLQLFPPLATLRDALKLEGTNCGSYCPGRVYSTISKLTKLDFLRVTCPEKINCKCVNNPRERTGRLKLSTLMFHTTPAALLSAFDFYEPEEVEVKEHLFIAFNTVPFKVETPDMGALWRLLSRIPMPPRTIIHCNDTHFDETLPHHMLEFFITAPNINELVLAGFTGLSLDRFVTSRQAGDAFPHLTKLEFGSNNVPLSLPSLLAIADLFPNLERLQYPADPRMPDGFAAPPRNGKPHPLNQLWVTEQPRGNDIERPSSKDIILIARAISATFPNLETSRFIVEDRKYGGKGAWAAIKDIMTLKL